MAEVREVEEMLVEYKSAMPYNNNEDCKLTFRCPKDQQVIIEVNKFELEHSYDCKDYLSLDGKHYCGLNVPQYVTKNSSIEIHFHSDNYTTANGFKLYLGCRG